MALWLTGAGAACQREGGRTPHGSGRREADRPQGRRDRLDDLQQPRAAQRRLARHVAGHPGRARRLRGRSGGAGGGLHRRRRAGVRLGRRHLAVRGRAERRQRRGALLVGLGRREHRHGGAIQALDRDDPRLLHRRRPGGGAHLRHPHLRGWLALCHSRCTTGPRLRLRRHQGADRPGGAGDRQGDPLHRPPVRRRGGACASAWSTA